MRRVRRVDFPTLLGMAGTASVLGAVGFGQVGLVEADGRLDAPRFGDHEKPVESGRFERRLVHSLEGEHAVHIGGDDLLARRDAGQAGDLGATGLHFHEGGRSATRDLDRDAVAHRQRRPGRSLSPRDALPYGAGVFSPLRPDEHSSRTHRDHDSAHSLHGSRLFRA